WWPIQPRHAAQRGLYFLQPSAVKWQGDANCFGCHVQTQTLMATAVARQNQYVLSGAAERVLSDCVLQCQTPEGSFTESPAETAAGSAGLATASISGSLAV